MKTSLSIIRIFRCILISVTALTFFGTSSKDLFGDVAYLRSDVKAPWSVDSTDPGSNEAAMDTAFGSGNWGDLRFETVDANSLFSSAYTFIFLEGGDTNANSMESFLTDNQTLIQNWVSNGGSLFLNAAPNEGYGMDFGFGISLNYIQEDELTHSHNAIPVDSSHAIFNKPYGETGSEFTGGWFSHATVSGDNLTPLIMGDVGTILAEMSYGQGHILAGGMTLAYFHDPKPQSYELLANILAYGASAGTSPIPEPSAYALVMATGLLGMVSIRRRK